MGQKINPIGLRVGVIRDWEAKWYAEKDFASLLHEDLRIRKFIDNELKEASVSHVDIERAANRINIAIHTGKPGMVLSLIHISEPTRREWLSRMPSSA